MSAYARLARPVLFRMSAERAHNITVRACQLVGAAPFGRSMVSRLYSYDEHSLQTRALGITLKNPLGMAAGFDKNGHAAPLLGSMGLGHVEIGSVSMLPSLGNPRPRLFRIPADKGVVVWYGVPNEGAEKVAATLKAHDSGGCPLGVNLVRTNTPEQHAGDAESVYRDYSTSFRLLQNDATYVTLNLSCPNADGQDFFDDPQHLAGLLDRLAMESPRVPVVLKLRPTQDPGMLAEIVRMSDGYEFVGGFAINLPSQRPESLTFTNAELVATMRGAIAGMPIRNYIDHALARLARVVGPGSRYTIMAAGGVFTGSDAYRKIRLGATLVQLYTSLIYRGPQVVPEILRDLYRLLDRDGFATVNDAVGADVWK